MPVDVTALNTAILDLKTKLTQAEGFQGFKGTDAATSDTISTSIANITAARAALQPLVTAAGLDSDLLAKRAALWQAIADGSNDVTSAMMAVALLTGAPWPTPGP
jgi:hypothetical protein